MSERPFVLVPYKSGEINKCNWGVKIAEGTYGELIRVYDPTHKMFVCIKKIKCNNQNPLGGPAVVLREIKILQQLQSCPQVVKLLDIIIDGRHYRRDTEWAEIEHIPIDVSLPMESVNLVFEDLCCDLTRFLNYDFTSIVTSHDLWSIRGDVSLDLIQSITFQILLALDFMEYCGIVHRDLKPQNILVAESGRTIRLCDFGLARRTHHGRGFPLVEVRRDGLTTEGVATLWYRPPEVICRCETNDVSLDMWSLGILVYEMVAGTPPFCLDPTELGLLYDMFRKLGTPNSSFYKSLKLFSKGTPKWPKVCTRHYFIEDMKRRDSSLPPALGHFIGSLLCIEPRERMSPREAMTHPLLSPVRHRYLIAMRDGWDPWEDDTQIKNFHEKFASGYNDFSTDEGIKSTKYIIDLLDSTLIGVNSKLEAEAAS